MSSTRNILRATGLLTVASAGVAYGVKKLADQQHDAFKRLPEQQQAACLKHMPKDTSVDALGAVLRHQQMVQAQAKVEEELAQQEESVSNRM